MTLNFTKREDSILPSKILARTKEVYDEGYYRWIVQIFMRHEGERRIETHRFWMFSGAKSINVINFLSGELQRSGLQTGLPFRIVGIAAFGGQMVKITKSVSYIPVVDLED